jgi:hypothetical protein
MVDDDSSGSGPGPGSAAIKLCVYVAPEEAVPQLCASARKVASPDNEASTGAWVGVEADTHSGSQ